MHRNVTIVAFALTGLCCAPMASAANPTINIGDITLLANQPNQVVPIYVTGAPGGTAIQGLDLYVETGDGGVSLGGTTGPLITGVDVKPAGGVFGSISDTPTDPGSQPQVAIRYLSYLSGTSLTIPNTPTLLADLTINTTGLQIGTYDLLLGDVMSQYSSDFASVPIDITNGTITLAAAVPEPVSLSALVIGALGLLRRRS